jgi:hypothetical protein
VKKRLKEESISRRGGQVQGMLGPDCGFEAVVNHPLRLCDFTGLLGIQSTLPTEQLGLERPAMIERQDVKRIVVTKRFHFEFKSEAPGTFGDGCRLFR